MNNLLVQLVDQLADHSFKIDGTLALNRYGNATYVPAQLLYKVVNKTRLIKSILRIDWIMDRLKQTPVQSAFNTLLDCLNVLSLDTGGDGLTELRGVKVIGRIWLY